MKKNIFSACLIFLGFVMLTSGEYGVPPSAGNPSSTPGDETRLPPSLKPVVLQAGPASHGSAVGAFPLSFIPNRGQAAAEALFYARASSYTLWITKRALVFDARGKSEASASRSMPREVSRLEFVGSLSEPEVTAQGPSSLIVNSFRGKDPGKWKAGIPTSRAVLYRGLYKEVDLKVYGRESEIEYDWVVNPGGRVEDIAFRFRAETGPALDEAGNLILTSRFGKWVHRRPAAYQRIGGRRVEVGAEFQKLAADTYGFKVQPYDSTYPLMIDPVVLSLSTFLGGSSADAGRGIAVSSAQFIFIAGYTASSDFPTASGYQEVPGGDDEAFLTKFNPAGNTLVFSTYFGGMGADRALALAVDGKGAAYLTGTTTSPDFPVRNAYADMISGQMDVFVAKIHPSGAVLNYSTYLGGAGQDEGSAIAIDNKGSAYVTGTTASSDFPRVKAFDNTQEGDEVFVTKLSPSGKILLYSTLLGGMDSDSGHGIAIDSSGAAYVTGSTSSSDYPVRNPLQAVLRGGQDAFVTKLNPQGTNFLYSTFLGGAEDDVAYGVAVDGRKAATVTGETASADFPLKNAYDSKVEKTDAFLTKIASSGNVLVYSTFLGGKQEDAGQAVTLGGDGSAYVAGYTKSADFPVYTAQDDTYNGGRDVFLTKFFPSGVRPVFSTFLGGSKNDTPYAVALDSAKHIYIAGVTGSSKFPVKAAYDAALNGGEDAFISKLDEENMQISSMHLYHGGEPASELDVHGQNFGDSQGAKRVVIDGYTVDPSKTMWWGDTAITLYIHPWLDPIYWDHIYEVYIEEGGFPITNVFKTRFPILIDGITPDSGGTGTEIKIYGFEFGATQGSQVLKMGSLTITTIDSWSNTQIQAHIPAALAGNYYIYLMKGTDIISNQVLFAHF